MSSAAGWGDGAGAGAGGGEAGAKASAGGGKGSAGSRLAEFRTFRERMNARIAEQKDLLINRFFTLDTQAYRAGALDAKTKEIAGLSASLVLRCDDCIAYHIIRCKEEGASDEEIWEVLGIGLVVGGSIVIPHLRRAVALLDELNAEGGAAGESAPS